MPEASSLRAVRAVVETLVPRTPSGPGAADLGVERHVAEAIEALFPGFVDMVAMLLDAYAADVRPGAAFADLDETERSGVIRAMALEPGQDIRELVGALMLFTFGGMYSEWTGYDRATGRLEAPAVWGSMGFSGPSRGHPDYREPGAAGERT
jgi:Gluconate 2-dehydrogenase subunit 3